MAVEPAGQQTLCCHFVLQHGSSARPSDACTQLRSTGVNGAPEESWVQLSSITCLHPQLWGTHVKSGSGMSQYSAALL